MQNPNVLRAQRSGILNQIGIQKMQSGNYVGAIETFNESLEIVPGSIHALQGRAFCKSMLYIVNPQLAPEEVKNYAQEIVLDLEGAIEGLQFFAN